MHGFGKKLHVCWFGLVRRGSSVFVDFLWLFLVLASGVWRHGSCHGPGLNGDWRLAATATICRYEKVENLSLNAINLQWREDRGKSGPISDPV